MFVVQSENITCHWKFSVYRAGLRLVKDNKQGERGERGLRENDELASYGSRILM